MPGCSRIQATTCTHTGVPYDGATYAYYVQAHNIEKTSPPGTPVTFDAVGKPANWGADHGDADRRGRPGAGDRHRARVARGGGARRHPRRPARSSGRTSSPRAPIINELVQTPGNDTSYPVQLRMCNEFAAKVGCSVSEVEDGADLRSDPVRPPQPAHRPGQTGCNVTWTISGTSNGDAALVGISIDGGAEEIVAQGAPGDFSFTRTVTVADYNTRTNIRVRLFDDNPAGRGEAVVYGQTESGDPPPPTVSIYKRARVQRRGRRRRRNDCSNLRPVRVYRRPLRLHGHQCRGHHERNFGCQVTQSTANQNLFEGYQGNMTQRRRQTTDWVLRRRDTSR